MGLLTSKEAKRKHARILMLGLDAAGKSTLLYRLKFGDTEFFTSTTIGFNVEMLEHSKSVTLTLWDIGGQHKMRQFWPYYFQDTDGLVFVVDSADKERMEDSKREFERMLKNDWLKGIPVVVIANKQDLAEALSTEEITKRFHMNRWCSDRDWYVQPCCAKTGEGLTAATKMIISYVKKKMNSKSEETGSDIQEDRL
ncbi:ADP-ribosylation factor-like protein 14 [Chiloscyllium plagiosum]|uniref:ADP-ribosylation factor-like protein 14 n=1 Tax=Chiloscyllium plagiosum TaxID=36176 RepID=UPI001CB833CC|nr:ADP-ribosylation factor-like protein 14 [Chiloscyllium plagiosum]